MSDAELRPSSLRERLGLLRDDLLRQLEKDEKIDPGYLGLLADILVVLRELKTPDREVGDSAPMP